MPEFRLFFFGLIAHIGDSGTKSHAVLVDAKEHAHTPRIYFSKSKKRDLDTFDHVWFSTDTAPTKTSATFDKYVPHLEVLTGSKLKTNVKLRTNKKDVAVNVLYPSSTSPLTAQDLYPLEKAVYKRNGQQFHDECVARLTSLTVPFTGSSVTVFGDDEELGRVEAEQCVLIANFDKSDPLKLVLDFLKSAFSHSRTKHVEEFKHLVDPPTIAQLDPKFKRCRDVDLGVKPPCTWITELLDSKKMVDTATQIECGNTQWP